MSIKFGLLGCGRIGQRHAQHINNHPEAVLASVFDIDTKKAQDFSIEHKTNLAGSLEEFLADDAIDMVNICTPNGIHFEGAMAALEAGKHVLVEKPMALKKEHCEQMVNLALKKNKHLFVVKQNRFNPPVEAIHNLIETGKLGKVYQVVVNCYWNRNEQYYLNSDWKGTKALDGGTLFTQFSHFVDIFYYLFGDIENINGIVKNVKLGELIEFEDSGTFTFNFKSGALGSFNYTTACYEQNMEGSITIFAENATIKVGGKYLNVLEYQKTANFDIGDLPVAGPANDYGYYQGSMSNHDKLIDNVVKTLNGKQDIMTNAFEGMKVVEIIENIYNSVKWIQ